MARLGEVVGCADGYTLRACLSVGRVGYMVVRDSDGYVVSRTYRTEADGRRGWLAFRVAGKDAVPERALGDVVASEAAVAERATQDGVA